ncbi:MAG: DUF2339 domain-containing protein [Gordonia sp. (in: high G+C Gram-positive bacteria)]
MHPNTDPLTAITRIGEQLDHLSTRLAEVSHEVSGLPTLLTAHTASPQAVSPQTPLVPTPPPHPSSVPAPSGRPLLWPQIVPIPPVAGAPAWQPPTPTPPFAPPTSFTPPPYTPHSGPPAGFPPPFPPPPRRPAPSMRDRISAAADRGTVGKWLAFVGVGITLIGVVLLLVLAAQAGLLRPEIRVAGGVLLATVLVGAGLRVGRHAERRVGATALVATGIATALFDVLAATVIYHWLPVVAALIATGVITAGGLALAVRWNRESLGVAVGIGLVALAPVLTGGLDLTLVVFLLVYAAAALAAQYGRDWLWLYLVNTVAVVVPLLLVAGFGSAAPTEVAVVTATGFTLTLASGILLLRSSTRQVYVAIVAATGLLPLLVNDHRLDAVPAAGLLACAAAGLFGAAIAGRLIDWFGFAARVVWLTAAVIAALAALAIGTGAHGGLIGLLGVAVILALAATVAGDLAGPVRILATVVCQFGLLTMLSRGALAQLVSAATLDQQERVSLMIAAVLAIIAVAVLAWSWMRESSAAGRGPLAVGAGILTLSLFTLFTVTLGTLVTRGTDAGFRAGHLAATIGCVLAAGGTLLWARRVHGTDRTLALSAGLAVIAVSVLKLFLFDLAALDGVFRVIAFIVVGLVLLSLGVAYAQTLSTDDTRPPVNTAH